MLNHHEATVANAVGALRQEPGVQAIIVGGSVARGVARPDSDVDLMLVVGENDYALRRRQQRCAELRYDLADYEGGYVDIKYIDLPFLQAAAQRGSEPARDAFRGAYAAWSRLDGLAELLAAIPAYPEGERASKLRSFYSQMLLQLYFVKHAGEDRFLLHHSADTMVFFGSRLLLTYGRVLFPNAKRLMQTVAALPSLPSGYFDAVDALLREPSMTTARAYVECLNSFHDWGMDWDAALGQYTEDTELSWLDSKPALADA